MCCVSLQNVADCQPEFICSVLGITPSKSGSTVLFPWAVREQLWQFLTQTACEKLIKHLRRMTNHSSFSLGKYGTVIKGMVEGLIKSYSVLMIGYKGVISTDFW